MDLPRKSLWTALTVVALATALYVLWPGKEDARSGGLSSDLGRGGRSRPSGEWMRDGGAPKLTGAEARPSSEPDQATNRPAVTPGKGTVVHVAGVDGTPVGHALVRLLRDDDGRPAAMSGGLIGAWRKTVPMEVPLLEERTWIEVLRPETADEEPLPLASGWAGPFDARTREVKVLLVSARTIAGRVVDASGQPCPGVRVVALLDRGERRRWEKHGEDRTAPDGSFRIGGLRQGPHHLEAWPRGPNAPPPALAVDAGQQDVELHLLPGVEVRLIVVDSVGAPVPETSIRIGTTVTHGTGFGTALDVVRGTTDDAGLVVLDGLDPKHTYVFSVTPPRQRKELVPISRSGWRPAGGTITLRHAVQVRGRTQYPGGRPFPFANVTVIPKGQAMVGLDGGSRKDGTFVIDGVPAGPVSVRAFRLGEKGMQWKAVPVDAVAPAADVVLVMKPDPVGTFVVRVHGAAGEQHDDWVRLTEDQGGARGAIGVAARPIRKGVATFERLRMKRRYILYAFSDDKSSCAYVRGVEPSDAGLDVTLAPALSIRGRVAAPDGATNVRVYANGPGLAQGGELSPSGDFEIKGLPEGTWTVGASASLGKRFLLKQVEASTGDSIDIELE